MYRQPVYSMTLRGSNTTAAEVYSKLVSSIANVYRDVMNSGFIDKKAHPTEYKLFNNPHRVVDGPCYVFLVHGRGPAVGGVGFNISSDETAISKDVVIQDNLIKNASYPRLIYLVISRTSFSKLCFCHVTYLQYRFNVSQMKFLQVWSMVWCKTMHEEQLSN